MLLIVLWKMAANLWRISTPQFRFLNSHCHSPEKDAALKGAATFHARCDHHN